MSEVGPTGPTGVIAPNPIRDMRDWILDILELALSKDDAESGDFVLAPKGTDDQIVIWEAETGEMYLVFVRQAVVTLKDSPRSGRSE